MDSELNQNRIRWACRRGMLELDMFLLPFFDNEYAQLSSDEQQTFTQLLQETDPTLWQWLLEQAQPEDEQYAKLIHKIIQHAQHHTKL